MSTDILLKVDEILEKANMPDRHTFFQIEKFIIGKEPTAQAQLWAIIRELQSRKESVYQLNKDLKDCEDNLELIDIKIERLDLSIKKQSKNNDEESLLNIKEFEINIRKLEREKESLILSAQKVNKKVNNIIEEIDFLLKGYEKITSNYENLKQVDDEQSQKDMWNEKLLEEFNLRIILQRPLDPEFVKTVLCLNDDAPVKIQLISLIENIQKKIISNKHLEKK